MHTATIAAWIGIVGMATAAAAQDAPSGQEVKEKVRAEMMARQAAGSAPMERISVMRTPLERVTTGAPYSADVTNETTQALGDGNHIARRTTGRVYRDGQGRTRREQQDSNGASSISIVDPVAGVAYQLDPDNHIAWKTDNSAVASVMLDMKRTAEVMQQKMKAEAGARSGGPGPGERGGVPAGAMMRGAAITPDMPLEHKVIEGVPVEGRKTTSTIPAGKIGNDLPITVVSEEWTSPDLHVLVMTHHSDPRTGDSTYRLTNIARGEPDPSLFTVPAGYDVRETGIRKQQQ